jgi:hypothetical protein
MTKHTSNAVLIGVDRGPNLSVTDFAGYDPLAAGTS